VWIENADPQRREDQVFPQALRVESQSRLIRVTLPARLGSVEGQFLFNLHARLKDVNIFK